MLYNPINTMKKYFCFVELFLILIISVTDSFAQRKVRSFSSKDADLAIESFNEHFFNKEMKLYNATSEKPGRAAIWTQAIYWDMMMNAYQRTGKAEYLEKIDEVYRGACEQYDNFNWKNTTEWFIYDDIMWWLISLSRAYQLTNDQKYLGLAISGFHRVWYGIPDIDNRGSYDQEKGGMRWGWKRDEWRGKMACINYPTVIAATLLYQITKKEEYFKKAMEIYNWSNENLFDKTTGAVADSKHGDSQAHWKTHLYNQATCIGAGVALFKLTKDSIYLKNSILATDYVRSNMCSKEGFLPFENGIEQGVYAAIFAQYIAELIACGQNQYLSWMQDNINNAWDQRDKKRNLTSKDFSKACPKGVLEVYDASACPALMQVIAPINKKIIYQ